MDQQDINAVYRNYLAAVIHFHLTAAETAHLGPTDYQASSVLDWHGPMPPGELAKTLGLSPSATTRVIDRLVEAGIAERTADTDDRRRVVVAHTGHLPGELTELLMAVRGPIAETVASLSTEQREGLLTYFRRATEIYGNGT